VHGSRPARTNKNFYPSHPTMSEIQLDPLFPNGSFIKENILFWFDFWCFNATFSNISAISWRSVLAVEMEAVLQEWQGSLARSITSQIAHTISTCIIDGFIYRSSRLYKAIYRIANMRSLSVKGVTCEKYNIN
jgi:hypothetical protein